MKLRYKAHGHQGDTDGRKVVLGDGNIVIMINEQRFTGVSEQ